MNTITFLTQPCDRATDISLPFLFRHKALAPPAATTLFFQFQLIFFLTFFRLILIFSVQRLIWEFLCEFR